MQVKSIKYTVCRRVRLGLNSSCLNSFDRPSALPTAVATPSLISRVMNRSWRSIEAILIAIGEVTIQTARDSVPTNHQHLKHLDSARKSACAYGKAFNFAVIASSTT